MIESRVLLKDVVAEAAHPLLGALMAAHLV